MREIEVDIIIRAFIPIQTQKSSKQLLDQLPQSIVILCFTGLIPICMVNDQGLGHTFVMEKVDSIRSGKFCIRLHLNYIK